jgi:hypothetical protein
MKPPRTVLSFASFSSPGLPRLPRFFVKPQLLTRTEPLPMGRDIPRVHSARHPVVSTGAFATGAVRRAAHPAPRASPVRRTRIIQRNRPTQRRAVILQQWGEEAAQHRRRQKTGSAPGGALLRCARGEPASVRRRTPMRRASMWFIVGVMLLGSWAADADPAHLNQLLQGDYAFTGEVTCLVASPSGFNADLTPQEERLIHSASVHGVQTSNWDGTGTVQSRSVSVTHVDRPVVLGDARASDSQM